MADELTYYKVTRITAEEQYVDSALFIKRKGKFYLTHRTTAGFPNIPVIDKNTKTGYSYIPHEFMPEWQKEGIFKFEQIGADDYFLELV